MLPGQWRQVYPAVGGLRIADRDADIPEDACNPMPDQQVVGSQLVFQAVEVVPLPVEQVDAHLFLGCRAVNLRF